MYDILNKLDDSADLYKKYVIPVNIAIMGVIVYKKDIFLNLINPAYNENITGWRKINANIPTAICLFNFKLLLSREMCAKYSNNCMRIIVK